MATAKQDPKVTATKADLEQTSAPKKGAKPVLGDRLMIAPVDGRTIVISGHQLNAPTAVIVDVRILRLLADGDITISTDTQTGEK